MSETESKLLLLGLPDAGKTTFVAALWHIVEQGVIEGSLRLEDSRGDRTHLNTLLREWLACRSFERTKPAEQQIFSLPLIDPRTKLRTSLTLPDMAGETFEMQWKDRFWTAEYDDLARKATGILLMVHPAKIIEPVRIDQVASLVDDIDFESADELPAPEPMPIAAWTADLAPTQVQLVELLQFISARSENFLSHRIAVIVSAWDQVMATENRPEIWLEKRLPFLAQYLEANPEKFECRVYGVSAQGREYSEHNTKDLLAKEPWERILVIGGDTGESPHDITTPIKWLMKPVA